MSEDAITEYYFAKVVLIFNQIIRERTIIQLLVNPLVPNAPFVYPLKTSENLKAFCFQGVHKACIGNKWVKRDNFFLILGFQKLSKWR